MPDDSNVIVVVGERDYQGALVAIHTMSYAEFQTSRYYSQREVDENPGADAPAVVVKVTVQNPANSERAQQAATRLVVAVARELQRLSAADPNATIVILGRSYLVGEILFDLNNTEFTVTDRTDFQNNGVGQSSRGEFGELNTDMINMDAILDQYGAMPYTDDLGMTILIFHEMGHISQIGTDFFNLSVSYYNDEPEATRGPFYPSDYSANNEAFASDFKNAVHAQLGIPAGMNPGGSNAIEPFDIFESHVAP
jgi:hypothetical protein